RSSRSTSSRPSGAARARPTSRPTSRASCSGSCRGGPHASGVVRLHDGPERGAPIGSRAGPAPRCTPVGVWACEAAGAPIPGRAEAAGRVAGGDASAGAGADEPEVLSVAAARGRGAPHTREAGASRQDARCTFRLRVHSVPTGLLIMLDCLSWLIRRKLMGSWTRARSAMDAPRTLASRRALIGLLLKMGAAYAVWFVLYDLWLLPDGRLDTWLSHVVAARTADVLAPFFDGVRVSGRVVRLGASPGIIVEDGCNGLSPLSLFVGFVLAYPGTARRRLLFIPAGLLVVSAVNVLRCAALLVVQAERPGWF